MEYELIMMMKGLKGKNIVYNCMCEYVRTIWNLSEKENLSESFYIHMQKDTFPTGWEREWEQTFIS